MVLRAECSHSRRLLAEGRAARVGVILPRLHAGRRLLSSEELLCDPLQKRPSVPGFP